MRNLPAGYGSCVVVISMGACSERIFGGGETGTKFKSLGSEGATGITLVPVGYTEPCDYPKIESNRDSRRNNQPFYRGLKKYRKP